MTVTESLAKGTALLALAFGLAHSAHAQILIGQTVGVTGSAAIRWPNPHKAPRSTLTMSTHAAA